MARFPKRTLPTEDWELQSGDYLAKKEWIKEDGDLGLVESGTLKLYHRPEN